MAETHSSQINYASRQNKNFIRHLKSVLHIQDKLIWAGMAGMGIRRKIRGDLSGQTGFEAAPGLPLIPWADLLVGQGRAGLGLRIIFLQV